MDDVKKIQMIDLYDEKIARVIQNLCPGCGADNMPSSLSILNGKALYICPECGFDRTPGSCPEYDDY